MKYKWHIIIGIILLLVIIVGILIFNYKKPSIIFNGNFSHLGTSSIFIKLPNESTEQEFAVTSATKFQRIALHIPTAAELAKTGGQFVADDLPKDVSTADFATFKQDASASASSGIGMEIVANRHIWSSKFEAQTITYRLAIFPK